MSARVTLGTARRVLRQLRRDHRTVALAWWFRPCCSLLVRYVFDGQPETFARVGPALVGIFPFVSMFLVTSIAMLRERTSGTLERLMSMPLGEARPAARLRDRIRGDGGRAGRDRVGGGVRPAGARRGRAALAGRRARGGQRTARHGARALPVGLRNAPSSRRCSSCRPSCCRSSCSAACSCSASACSTCSRPPSWVLPLTYAYDALAQATGDRRDRR